MSKQQGTLARSVECEGIGLHSGEFCRVRLVPRDSGGRCFVAAEGVEIPATIDHVVADSRATILGVATSSVGTVEHLLAVLAVSGIDHVRVEVDGPELPAFDGSASGWLDVVAAAGRRDLEAEVAQVVLTEAIEVREAERWIRAEPAEALSIDYAIDFDVMSIGRQRCVLEPVGSEFFATEIAPARTFVLHREVEALRAAGLARGGSLENALVFDEAGPIGAATLRFPDECVRHKVIDLLGDLALLGAPLAARIRVERGGHRLHHALVRAIAGRPAAPRARSGQG